MTKQSVPLGALYTTLSTITVVLMAMLIKWASHGYATEFLMATRWTAGLALFLAVWLAARGRTGMATRHPGMQIGAALCWTGATFAYYLSIRFIPLMDATLLLYTSSLFGPLVARLLSGVREPGRVWLGIGVGFAGVAVVLNPNSCIFSPWSLVALASGLLMALRVHFNRELSHDDPKERTSFYSLSVGLAACLAAWAATGLPVGSWRAHMFTPTTALQPWLVDGVLLGAVVALGLLSMLQAWLVAFGLEHASVGKVGPFLYMGVIFAALADWLVWGVKPSACAVAGLVIIVAGGLIVLRGKKEPS